MKAVGLDIGGSRLRAGLVERGRVLAHHCADLGEDKRPERVVDLICGAVAALAPDAGTPVGVGFAALIRPDGVVASSPNHGWRDVPLAALLRERLARPFALDNDLTAITWGEYRHGAGRGTRSIVCVFVGTGVGGGAVLDGRLWRGAKNVALEVGHVKVVADGGPPCGCGGRGCLEAFVGGGYVGPSPDWMTLGRVLGRALGNLVAVLDPERLVLGGGVWRGQPVLRGAARAEIARSTVPPSFEGLRIVDDELGDDAGVIGAADLAAGGGASAR